MRWDDFEGRHLEAGHRRPLPSRLYRTPYGKSRHGGRRSSHRIARPVTFVVQTSEAGINPKASSTRTGRGDSMIDAGMGGRLIATATGMYGLSLRRGSGDRPSRPTSLRHRSDDASRAGESSSISAVPDGHGFLITTHRPDLRKKKNLTAPRPERKPASLGAKQRRVGFASRNCRSSRTSTFLLRVAVHPTMAFTGNTTRVHTTDSTRPQLFRLARRGPGPLVQRSTSTGDLSEAA
jgi:hypothetical protein